MKRWALVGSVLLTLLLVGGVACKAPHTVVQQQFVKVTRGDLTLVVSGSGNIKALNDTKLSFGSGGRVNKVSLKEGDRVKKGDILAELDTDALKLARTQAQVALTQAQIALSQAQLAQKSADLDLKVTQDQKAVQELALLNAQISLRTAQYNLSQAQKTYTWPDIQKAQATVDEDKAYLSYAAENYKNASTSAQIEMWANAVAVAELRLAASQAKLDAQLKGFDTEEVAIKKLQVTSAEQAVPVAQAALDKLTQQIAMKQDQVKLAADSVSAAKQAATLTQQSLDQAQKQIDQATIMAPFDGVIASVSVQEGDTVSPVNSVLRIVDVVNVEASVDMDEIDVPAVKAGQQANVTADALPGQVFKGNVTKILPVPTVTGGVVQYTVKISLSVPESSGLRIGMSASADIVTDSRTSVLLVPAKAVGDVQGKTVVKVLVNQQVQERTVTVGISDGTQTEITSGLNEGDTVVITVAQSPASSTPGLF